MLAALAAQEERASEKKKEAAQESDAEEAAAAADEAAPEAARQDDAQTAASQDDFELCAAPSTVQVGPNSTCASLGALATSTIDIAAAPGELLDAARGLPDEVTALHASCPWQLDG